MTTRTPTTDATTAPSSVTRDATGGDSETGSQHVVSRGTRQTNHWTGVSVVVFATAALGVLTATRPLLLAAVVGVGYLAYARVESAPEVSLAIRRSLSDASPDPGDEVTVTVTVENTGETLADLRLVDGVPPALEVVDGPARFGTSLRSGASATFSYTVLARRGDHEFDSLTAIARTLSGSVETDVEFRTSDRLTCTPSLDTTTTVPLRSLTSRYTGRVDTSTGGEGVEFFSTREYRPGDSLSRVDWNRLASHGTLSTLQFREERTATVVLLLDLRRAAYLQAGDDGLHAVDRSVDAAGRLFSALLSSGDRVGIAALAPDDVWLPPGTGNEHRARARDLLATNPSLSPTPPDRYFTTKLLVRKLQKRLPADAQILLLSPLCDDAITTTARLLHARGHLVTAVSPDPTMDDTPGHRLAAAERGNRVSDLRTAGIRVVDWDASETLAAALARSELGWSR